MRACLPVQRPNYGDLTATGRLAIETAGEPLTGIEGIFQP
jgi:hypothetical protein